MIRTFFAAAIVAVSCCASWARVNVPVMTDPAPGVSRDLARYRAAHYRDVRYALGVTLSPGSPVMTGSAEIHVTLDNPADDLVLDWRIVARQDQPPAAVSELNVNGRAVSDARQVNDHLLIPGRYLVRGENDVRLRFTSPVATSGSAVTRYIDRQDGSEYIYTLFVPSDASTAFPCFDQPDLKARFTLEMTAPSRWAIVTNTLPVSPAPQPQAETKTQTVRFHETEPISTYLFAFAAGDFEQFTDESSPYHTRVFARRSVDARARKEMPEIFRLHREGLRFLAGYFDYPYPFPKYDVVLVPEFAYGGMEHAGATFLREDGILFPTDPTANDLLSRAEVIFHEAAHQWFGDLTTMRWFDDLWLKEGFATFMAFKAIEAIMPERNAWKVFYQKTKPAAYLTDATRGTTPIFQEIPNLSAAKSAYGNIVYRKAPSMLRQAEFFLGPDKFQSAVRLFLKEHAFGNAEWADLVRAFERTTGRSLGRWAEAWVKRRGMPEVTVHWSTNARGLINSFSLGQRDVLGEGGAWPMRLRVLLAYDGRPAETFTVSMNDTPETPVPELIGKPRPLYVFANYEDYGYGRFPLDAESRRVVLGSLGTVSHDFLRALLWGSLWDSVREAELAPAEYVDLVIRLVGSERDEVTVASLVGHARTAFNYYLSDSQAASVAPRLERLFYNRMLNAESAGLRITYFRAYESIATTPEARANLKKILGRELSIPGMTLRSRDRFDIITSLMARGDKDAPALLEAQSAEDQSDDGRRYSYAAGAARADEETKKRYFDAYLHDTRLAESWIEASLNPFNSVQQETLTLPYLAPALAELPVLKRTRKIFFVNGWLAAFIGGQRSPHALGTVNDYLAREKGLDRDLRLKVLEAVDSLERTVRIRARYAGA